MPESTIRTRPRTWPSYPPMTNVTSTSLSFPSGRDTSSLTSICVRASKPKFDLNCVRQPFVVQTTPHISLEPAPEGKRSSTRVRSVSMSIIPSNKLETAHSRTPSATVNDDVPYHLGFWLCIPFAQCRYLELPRGRVSCRHTDFLARSILGQAGYLSSLSPIYLTIGA